MSTFLTMVYVPVLYSLFEDARLALARRFAPRRAGQAVPVEGEAVPV